MQRQEGLFVTHSRPTESALRQSIERLYLVFSRYPLKKMIEGCPCCTTDEDHDRIHSKPLRELASVDLDRFAMKALSTWGSEADLKHFLPRLLELFAHDPGSFTLPEALIGKLANANPSWREWPGTEREALEAYFTALWLWRLDNLAYPFAEAWLAYFAGIYADLTPFLQLWANQFRSEGAMAQLALFLHDNDEPLRRGALSRSWRDSPQAKQQIIAWANDSHTRTLLKSALPRVRALPWLEDQGVSQAWIDWILDE